MRRAKFDLNCPSERLTIQPLGGATYGVTGCGQRATYIVICSGEVPVDGTCTAILNSDSRKAINSK